MQRFEKLNKLQNKMSAANITLRAQMLSSADDILEYALSTRHMPLILRHAKLYEISLGRHMAEYKCNIDTIPDKSYHLILAKYLHSRTERFILQYVIEILGNHLPEKLFNIFVGIKFAQMRFLLDQKNMQNALTAIFDLFGDNSDCFEHATQLRSFFAFNMTYIPLDFLQKMVPEEIYISEKSQEYTRDVLKCYSHIYDELILRQ